MNDSLERKVDAILRRMDEISASVADIRTTIRLMDQRVIALERDVAEHKRVLEGGNGGWQAPGLIATVQRMQQAQEHITQLLGDLSDRVEAQGKKQGEMEGVLDDVAETLGGVKRAMSRVLWAVVLSLASTYVAGWIAVRLGLIHLSGGG